MVINTFTHKPVDNSPTLFINAIHTCSVWRFFVWLSTIVDNLWITMLTH